MLQQALRDEDHPIVFAQCRARRNYVCHLHTSRAQLKGLRALPKALRDIGVVRLGFMKNLNKST